MEPPAFRGFAAVHNEKAKVFQAMRPLTRDDVVRGQYAGYRNEANVAKTSDVETFCALRLSIDSWCWEGVRWYLRSGKCLADTAHEVLVQLKPPPQDLFADSAPADGRANYLRFRLSPGSAVALAARVKRPGKEYVGDQRELYLVEELPGEEPPYERLLTTLSPATARCSPVRTPLRPPGPWSSPSSRSTTGPWLYKRGTWGPKEADDLIAADGGWYNPKPTEEPKCQA